MASISKISYYLKRGRQAEALASVANFNTVVSEAVTTGGSKVKCLGYVMHVSKAKKLTVTKTVAEKRQKQEVSYFRLVFCRENGINGEMFAVLFQPDDKEIFALSRVSVGEAALIVKPRMHGEWMGLRILRTSEPMLKADFVSHPFLPQPFPTSGFVAFTFSDVGLQVLGSRILTTCSGHLCGGLYGKGNCACVTTSQLPRHVFGFELSLQEFDENDERRALSTAVDLKWPELISVKLTNQLIHFEDLAMALTTNDDAIPAILDHAEHELEDGKWTVVGWCKASSTTGDGVPLVTPKCHIVSLTKSIEIKRWIRPQPQQAAAD